MLPGLPSMIRTLSEDTPFLCCKLIYSMLEALLRNSFGHKDWLMCGGLAASSMQEQLPASRFLGVHGLRILHVEQCCGTHRHTVVMEGSDYESFRAQHKSLVSMEDCRLNPAQVVNTLIAVGECYAGQSNRRYTCFGVRDV